MFKSIIICDSNCPGEKRDPRVTSHATWIEAARDIDLYQDAYHQVRVEIDYDKLKELDKEKLLSILQTMALAFSEEVEATPGELIAEYFVTSPSTPDN